MCEFSIALETQHTAKVRCKLHARIKGIESANANNSRHAVMEKIAASHEVCFYVGWLKNPTNGKTDIQEVTFESGTNRAAVHAAAQDLIVFLQGSEVWLPVE